MKETKWRKERDREKEGREVHIEKTLKEMKDTSKAKEVRKKKEKKDY